MGSEARRVRAVRRHRVPAWWSDAKLGIFVHWTPASVPAFAPVDAEIGELLARRDPEAMAWSPYSEWYQNSLRFPSSPAARHHAEVWGNRDYHDFAGDWEAGLEGWDPDGWAGRFAATGARYVVLVTKHHDGYCLWPTQVANPHRPGFHSRRDVVGELAEAVRSRGMRFGVYYSGGLDWTFNDHPIGAFSDVVLAQPRGGYVGYAEAHIRELIARYRPSVLWNDISWPGDAARLARLLCDYYEAVPDGVVNDRFMPWSRLWHVARTKPGRMALDRVSARSARADRGLVPPKPPMFDVRTPEYTVFDTVQPTPWECVRGIDRSFGHNDASGEEHFVTRDELVWSLADIAAKGGNLLLNVGPRGVDATIAQAQLTRLDWLGEFTAEVGEALFATRPWVHPTDGAVADAGSGAAPGEGAGVDGRCEVRYTARDTTVFAMVRGDGDREVTLASVRATATTTVHRVAGGSGARRDRPEPGFEATPGGLRVRLGTPLEKGVPIALALEAVDSQAEPARGR